MPRASSETSTVNKPWVENYPALKEWLNKIGARCLEQVPGPKMAKSKDPTFYIEKWICGSHEFYIEVRANQLGWNIYTGCSSSMITDTLRDAERRLKFTVSGLGAHAVQLETGHAIDASEWEASVLGAVLSDLRRAVKHSAKSLQLDINISSDKVTFVEAKLDNVTLSGVTHWMPGPKPEADLPPVPPIEEALTTEALSAVLNEWCLRQGIKCASQGIKCASADDLVQREDLDDEQIEWLDRFIDRWDEVEKAEVKAKKAAGASCS